MANDRFSIRVPALDLSPEAIFTQPAHRRQFPLSKKDSSPAAGDAETPSLRTPLTTPSTAASTRRHEAFCRTLWANSNCGSNTYRKTAAEKTLADSCFRSQPGDSRLCLRSQPGDSSLCLQPGDSSLSLLEGESTPRPELLARTSSILLGRHFRHNYGELQSPGGRDAVSVGSPKGSPLAKKRRHLRRPTHNPSMHSTASSSGSRGRLGTPKRLHSRRSMSGTLASLTDTPAAALANSPDFHKRVSSCSQPSREHRSFSRSLLVTKGLMSPNYPNRELHRSSPPEPTPVSIRTADRHHHDAWLSGARLHRSALLMSSAAAVLPAASSSPTVSSVPAMPTSAAVASYSSNPVPTPGSHEPLVASSPTVAHTNLSAEPSPPEHRVPPTQTADSPWRAPVSLPRALAPSCLSSGTAPATPRGDATFESAGLFWDIVSTARPATAGKFDMSLKRRMARMSPPPLPSLSHTPLPSPSLAQLPSPARLPTLTGSTPSALVLASVKDQGIQAVLGTNRLGIHSNTQCVEIAAPPATQRFEISSRLDLETAPLSETRLVSFAPQPQSESASDSAPNARGPATAPAISQPSAMSPSPSPSPTDLFTFASKESELFSLSSAAGDTAPSAVSFLPSPRGSVDPLSFDWDEHCRPISNLIATASLDNCFRGTSRREDASWIHHHRRPLPLLPAAGELVDESRPASLEVLGHSARDSIVAYLKATRKDPVSAAGDIVSLCETRFRVWIKAHLSSLRDNRDALTRRLRETETALHLSEQQRQQSELELTAFKAAMENKQSRERVIRNLYNAGLTDNSHQVYSRNGFTAKLSSNIFQPRAKVRCSWCVQSHLEFLPVEKEVTNLGKNSHAANYSLTGSKIRPESQKEENDKICNEGLEDATPKSAYANSAEDSSSSSVYGLPAAGGNVLGLSQTTAQGVVRNIDSLDSNAIYSSSSLTSKEKDVFDVLARTVSVETQEVERRKGAGSLRALSVFRECVRIEIEGPVSLTERALDRLLPNGRVAPGLPPRGVTHQRQSSRSLQSLWHSRVASADRVLHPDSREFELSDNDLALRRALVSWAAERAADARSTSYRRIYGQKRVASSEFRGMAPPAKRAFYVVGHSISRVPLKVPVGKESQMMPPIRPAFFETELHKLDTIPVSSTVQSGPREKISRILSHESREKTSDERLQSVRQKSVSHERLASQQAYSSSEREELQKSQGPQEGEPPAVATLYVDRSEMIKYLQSVQERELLDQTTEFKARLPPESSEPGAEVQKRSAAEDSHKKVLENSETETEAETAPAKKAPPPPSRKKAPPLVKKKAPPGKKPPPKREKDKVPLGPDPYVPTPPAHLKARNVNWTPLVDGKLTGTIWDGLLEEESKWPRADAAFEKMEVEAHQASLSVGTSMGRTHQRRPSIVENQPVQTSAMKSRRNSVLPTATGYSRAAPPHYVWDRGAGLFYVASRFEPDYEDVLELFFEDEAAKKERMPARVTSASKLQARGILDGRKLQNLEISLKGLGIYQDWESVKRTVLELDLGIPETSGLNFPHSSNARPLDATECSVIVGLLPTAEEESLLKSAAPGDLAKAEEIILEWLRIPRFKQRVECCVTILNYRSEIDKLQQRQRKMRDCLEALQKMTIDPPSLKALLGVCLRLGNFLNFYTNKKAKGLALNSLETFKRVNSVDGSTNMLKFIAEILDSQFPSVWKELEDGLKGCCDCSSLNPDECGAQISILEQSLRKVRVEVTDFVHFHDDKFLEIMTKFVEDGANTLQQLRDENETILKDLLFRAKLFNPASLTVQDGLDVMHKLGAFWNDLVLARNQTREKTVRQTLKNLRRSKGKPVSGNLSAQGPSSYQLSISN